MNDRSVIRMNFDDRAPGRTIRRLRLERGLSQEVLSGLSGIARSHLSMIETGEKRPTLNTLSNIASALGLKLSALIERMEEDVTAP